MSDQTVQELAEDYLRRCREGERPRIQEYTAAHPDLADEIRDVFSTLAMLEEVAPDHAAPKTTETRAIFDTPENLGDYRIVRELGRGGMGVVYEAEHKTMRRRVALKVLHPRSEGRGHDLERFLREARAAGKLHHTNIVPVFEVGSHERFHFYAMQCIRGQNLDIVLADLRQMYDRDALEFHRGDIEQHSAAGCLVSGRFQRSITDSDAVVETEQASASNSASALRSPDSSDLSSVGTARENYFHRVARIGLQVAEALAYAHQHGILHRDIKPANLILDTGGTVWVTDFGLARSEGEDLTQTGDVVGTLRYMAPERFRGHADARSDVYSLGLTLYELCTLRHAFDQKDQASLIRHLMRGEPPRPRRINSSIPGDLETIILKAIEREPAGRYRAAEKLADDLRLFLSDRPIHSRRISPLEHAWRWCRRNPFAAGLLTCIAALIAVIVVGAVTHAIKTQEYARQLQDERRKLQEESDLGQVRLYEAYVARARAERHNQLSGQHESAVDALRGAARLVETQPWSVERKSSERRALRDEAVALFAKLDSRPGRSPFHGEAETTVAFDHEYASYAISRASIEIRRADDDSLLRRLPQQQFRAGELLFSRDGSFLVSVHRKSGKDEKQVRLWNLSDHKAVLELEASVALVRFSSARHTLALVHGNTLTLHHTGDEPNGQRTREFPFRVRDVCFCGKNDLAVGGDAPRLVVWSLEQDALQRRPLDAKIASLAWCDRTGQLAVGLQSGMIQIHPLDNPAGDPIELRGHYDSVHTLSISDDGQVVASSSWDTTTRLWDVKRSEEFKRLQQTSLQGAIAGDGKRICCTTSQRKADVFEITRNGVKHRYFSDLNVPRRNDICFHPRDRRLAAVATGHGVELWNVNSHRIVRRIESQRTFAARFSNDGQALITSGRRGIRRWQIAEESDHDPEPEIWTTDGDSYRIGTLQDLATIAAVRRDGRITVIRPGQDKQPVEIDSASNFYRVDISPDGKWAVASRLSGPDLMVFDTATGRPVINLDETSGTAAASFSPDGRWLAANGKFRSLWRVADWKRVFHQQNQISQFGQLAFTADGSMIAMTRDRSLIELVDRETFDVVASLPVDDRRNIEQLSFSPDGSRLAVALQDHFEVWDLDRLRSRLQVLGLDW